MIVTFTSIPPRFAYLGAMLRGIEAQTLRPDAVELYIPRSYRRFPGQVPSLPPLPDWVKVIEVAEDLGPATKILPAAARWRGRGVEILFGDDDKSYDPQWCSRFQAMRRLKPRDALCEFGRELEFVTRRPDLRRRRPALPRVVLSPPAAQEGPRKHFAEPGYTDVFYGFAGAMIKPEWLDHRAEAIPDIVWTVDDVWISGMLELAGRRIWVGDGLRGTANPTEAGKVHALLDHVEQGIGRFAANALCAEYMQKTFGIWRDALPHGDGSGLRLRLRTAVQNALASRKG